MVKTHKRKRNSRIRGSKTCGWGFRQKHKGPGNRGGRGMSGAGKRADQKKQMARESDTSNRKQYFGKQGVTSRGTKKKKENKINLEDIKANFFKKDGEKIELTNYVILGDGEGFKAEISAKRASRGAILKMKKAGGNIIVKIANDDEEKEPVEEIAAKPKAKKDEKAVIVEKSKAKKAVKKE